MTVVAFGLRLFILLGRIPLSFSMHWHSVCCLSVCCVCLLQPVAATVSVSVLPSGHMPDMSLKVLYVRIVVSKHSEMN